MRRLRTAIMALLAFTFVVGQVFAGVNLPPPTVANIPQLTPRLQRDVVVAYHSQTMYTSGTGFTKITWRSSAVIAYNANHLRFTFDNFYGRETATPNSVAIKAAVEYPALSGNIYPIYFNGARTAIIDSGGTITSDALALDVTAGQALNVRTLQDYTNYGTTTATFITGLPIYGSTTAYPGGAGTTSGDGSIVNADNVDSGGSFSTTPGVGYGPTYITGTTTDPTAIPPVLIVGDSTVAATTGAAWTSYGYIQRALQSAGIPFVCIGCGGERGSGFAAIAGRIRRMRHAFGCQTAYVDFGVNDISVDLNSAATVEANLLTIWNVLNKAGLRVYAGTVLPFTTSTDFWVTTTNQTKGSGESVRLAVNAYIRSMPAPLSGVFDIASKIEVNSSNVLTQDGGYWPAATVVSAGITPTSGTTTAATYSGTPFTLDADRTYLLLVTAGTNSGLARAISQNTTSVLTLAPAMTSAMDNTSTGTLYRTGTNDGIHPSESQYAGAATAINPTVFR